MGTATANKEKKNLCKTSNLYARLNPQNNGERRDYHAHFPDEETEAHMGFISNLLKATELVRGRGRSRLLAGPISVLGNFH